MAEVWPERGRQSVYNLEVEGKPEYFANGILVHNCVWALTELGACITPTVWGGEKKQPEDERLKELRRLVDSAETDEQKAELVQIMMEEGVRL